MVNVVISEFKLVSASSWLLPSAGLGPQLCKEPLYQCVLGRRYIASHRLHTEGKPERNNSDEKLPSAHSVRLCSVVCSFCGFSAHGKGQDHDIFTARKQREVRDRGTAVPFKGTPTPSHIIQPDCLLVSITPQ